MMSGYLPLDAAFVLASLMVARMLVPWVARRVRSGDVIVLAGMVTAPLVAYGCAWVGWTV